MSLLARPARLVPVVAVVAAACGPGLETMHESNLRFEHCYRLDMDPRIAVTHREHCWRDWSRVYASGQPMDRVEYAQRRITQLETGDMSLVRIVPASQAEGRVFEESGPPPGAPMAAPAPTSAHAPPPAIAPTTAPPAPAVAPGRPGDACAGQCDSTLQTCSRLCEARQADCAQCREDYRKCMRRCYE